MVLAASGSPVDLAIRRQRRAPKTTNKHRKKKQIALKIKVLGNMQIFPL